MVLKFVTNIRSGHRRFWPIPDTCQSVFSQSWCLLHLVKNIYRFIFVKNFDYFGVRKYHHPSHKSLFCLKKSNPTTWCLWQNPQKCAKSSGRNLVTFDAKQVPDTAFTFHIPHKCTSYVQPVGLSVKVPRFPWLSCARASWCTEELVNIWCTHQGSRIKDTPEHGSRVQVWCTPRQDSMQVQEAGRPPRPAGLNWFANLQSSQTTISPAQPI